MRKGKGRGRRVVIGFDCFIWLMIVLYMYVMQVLYDCWHNIFLKIINKLCRLRHQLFSQPVSILSYFFTIHIYLFLFFLIAIFNIEYFSNLLFFTKILLILNAICLFNQRPTLLTLLYPIRAFQC